MVNEKIIWERERPGLYKNLSRYSYKFAICSFYCCVWQGREEERREGKIYIYTYYWDTIVVLIVLFVYFLRVYYIVIKFKGDFSWGV